MPLSKRYLGTNEEMVRFDVGELAEALKAGCPTAQFALLLGSAVNGCVQPHGDVDLAFHVVAPAGWEFRRRVAEICRSVIGEVRCDMGILNHAEPVYRFEALKGRLLFVRDQEAWLRFYSVSCREYEHQMIHYERQWRYRMEEAPT